MSDDLEAEIDNLGEYFGRIAGNRLRARGIVDPAVHAEAILRGALRAAVAVGPPGLNEVIGFIQATLGPLDGTLPETSDKLHSALDELDLDE